MITQEEFKELFLKFCKDISQLSEVTGYNNRYKENYRLISNQDNSVIEIKNQFKEVMKYVFGKLNIHKILFTSYICYNSLHLNGMFVYNDNYYKFSTGWYNASSNSIHLEITPGCKTYNEDSGKQDINFIWRRNKRYYVTPDFSVKDLKLPRSVKCKAGDIVTVNRRRRWMRDEKKLATVTDVSVCGTVYYKVKYLDKRNFTESYVTENRLIKLKHGL